MHETKYQPMDKVDAEAIMEEILGMQCGLNPNQQVGNNGGILDNTVLGL